VFAVLAASLRSVEAQPKGKVARIGYLSNGFGSASTYRRPLELFRQTLRERGWIEGQNLGIEFRYADGQADRLPALAEDLVRLNVDVIAASPTPSAIAARHATQTIPIVGMGLVEPVAMGLVASLARPGGNVTGVTYNADTAIVGKQLELLKEFVPKARLIAVLSNPGSTPTLPLILREIEAAARSLGLQLQLLEARSPDDFDTAFAAMGRAHVDALLVTGDTVFFQHRARLAELAARSRLPALSTQAQWVEGGGLVAYGPSLPELWRRAALLIDKILRGASAADLPIEEPTQFELTLNLKAARAAGLTVPKSVLTRADMVID
jgi:putative ABC transport system substrate-binding protein